MLSGAGPWMCIKDVVHTERLAHSRCSWMDKGSGSGVPSIGKMASWPSSSGGWGVTVLRPG